MGCYSEKYMFFGNKEVKKVNIFFIEGDINIFL